MFYKPDKTTHFYPKDPNISWRIILWFLVVLNDKSNWICFRDHGGYLENYERLINMMEECLKKVIEKEKKVKTLKQSSWVLYFFFENLQGKLIL